MNSFIFFLLQTFIGGQNFIGAFTENEFLVWLVSFMRTHHICLAICLDLKKLILNWAILKIFDIRVIVPNFLDQRIEKFLQACWLILRIS